MSINYLGRFLFDDLPDGPDRYSCTAAGGADHEHVGDGKCQRNTDSKGCSLLDDGIDRDGSVPALDAFTDDAHSHSAARTHRKPLGGGQSPQEHQFKQSCIIEDRGLTRIDQPGLNCLFSESRTRHAAAVVGHFHDDMRLFVREAYRDPAGFRLADQAPHFR